MKKLLPLLFFLISHLLSAQTSTETFETESISSTSFTDNGVIFDIKSHASVFDIQGDFVGTGWSGTAKDNRYIDNINSVNDISPSFSIKTTSNLFKVNRFWVYLANQYSNQNTTGSLTITGKLSGVTKFTQTKTTGFATSLGSTNGYTLIDMTNLNGQNYSNIVIDELQITANGNYKYVGLDAFTWVKDSNIVLPESKPFITIWEVPDNGKIEIYTTNSYNYNYNISWEKIGDSSKKGIESLKKGNTTISNLSAGKYKVSITGVFPYFRAGKEFEDNNAKQLLSVNQWGTQRWKSMKESFQSATNLTSVDNDSPDLTDVTDMSRMFDHASSFNSDLNNWDVSKVTDMSYMFSGANSFNGNVSNWNVSNVTTMQGMFQVASVFNRDLSNWNVANVTDMIQVFSLANQFTSDLSNWNVANVTDMSNMFSFASSFTSDLSKWNVSKVTNMSAMFHAASSFTSDLSKWDISKVAYMPQILEYSKMSVDNYDATLKGWANLAAVPKGITFGVLGLKYCNASTERDKLIKEKGWEIKGDIKLGSDYILNNKTVVYNKQPHDIKLNTTPIAPLAVKYEIYDSSNKEIPEAINIGEYTVKAIISGCGADEIKKATLSITSVLKVTTSKTDVSCNGGSDGTASVSVLGGTTPYRYVWSTGATTQSITGLAEGTYTVTAIDANNYASTETFTVIQPTALTAITSKTDVSCNGGSNGTATVIPSGGAGGYTYSWAPSGGTAATATGLAPGIYTVTVTDANACVITRTFTITQPTALTATMSQTNVSCNGRSDGTASVTTLGGTGTYTYSWYPSGGTAATATGLAPGIYTVTVTDANSCTTTATATAIITEPNVVQTPKVTSSSVNYKYGDSATALVATNDSNHTLKWYEGDNKTLLTKVPLPITNKIGKQTYWVSQVNSTGCESELVKIEVTITPTNLTVTADAQSKVYGSVDPTLTYQVTGLVNAEKVSDVLVGSLIRVPGENVGSYAITQGDLKASSNYTLDFKTNNLEITEATLTVTADTQFKVYGSVDPTLTYQVTGLVNAEKVSDVLVGSLIRVPGENVGSYAITQGDLKASSNYTLDFKTNNLEITPATLTVTADAQSKVYGSVDPVLTYQVTGLVNAEKESDVLVGSLIRVPGENVGSYAITQGDLKASSNYTLDFKTNNLEITEATLTVTADTQSKIYGSVDPTLTYKVLGLVNAEKESDVLVGSLTRIAGEDVGTYLINKGTLVANGNYTLDFKTNNLEITPASLTVTADTQSKTYGSVDPTLTYKVLGLVNAEKESDVLVGSLTRIAGEDVGTYLINKGTLVANGNYTMTFTRSNLTITPANLTVTADAQFKVYGSVDPVLTYQVTGLVNAEKESDVLVGSLIRVPGENVGSYAITQGDLKASSNYTLDFKTNNLEITEATLTVTADTQSKIYGSVDPVLTYKVSGLVNVEKESDVLVGSLTRIAGEDVGTYLINKGTLVANGNYTLDFKTNNLEITPASLTVTADTQSKTYGSVDPVLTYKVSGLVNVEKDSDVLSGNLSRDKGENVGLYIINQGTLVANGNYTMTFTRSNLTITPANLTVTADAKTKVYGSADSVLTYKVSGLVNAEKESDVLVGSLTRLAGENVGTYIINQGTLVANGNYTMTFAGNNLTITPANLTVTADAQSKVYGSVDPTLTYKVSGLVNAEKESDVLSGNLSRDKGENVGRYIINQGALLANANYSLAFNKAELTITKAAITGVKLEDASYVYDGHEKALLISGNLPKDATVSYVANKQTEAGVYEVTALVTAPNYIDLSLKAKLTISKAAITGVKLEDASYVYDGQEKELLISGNLPKDAKVSYLANKQTEAGVYEVTALVTAPNYIDLPLKAKLTISKASITGVKLEDACYVYDGHEKALLISGNLPKDATVSYVSNKQIEAGVYDVTALVSAPNYIDLPLKAKLTISKAKQEITFNKLTPIVFDKNIQLQLIASSNSGLPVSYTYSYEGSKAAAIVSPLGTVTVVSPGRIVITAHQVGNNNYEPAKSISQEFIIINDEALITDWKINGQRQGALSSTGMFRQDCNEITDQMNIELETSVGAEVSTGSKFTILTPKAGIYRQEVVVTSQSGSTTKKYEIVIERPFGFDDIVIQKFDNTLLVNNNPQTNGGYRFIGYRWYKNDQLIGTEQVYSVGNKKEDLLDLNALYRVELVTDKGEVLHSCASTIRYTHTKNIQLYPNPVVKNGVLEVAIDYPNTALDQMSASVYSLTGQFLFTVPLQGAVSKVNLPSNMVEGVYIMLIKIEGKTKTFRFMVKP